MKNSLAVRQFSALCRGQMAKQAPQIHQIKQVCEAYRLCTRCQNPGMHDTITFEDGTVWQICRVCRQLFENKVMTECALLDDGSFHKIESQVDGPEKGER